MVDPADSVTEPLPVTIPCPTSLKFISPGRLYSVVLAQDLFGQWCVTLSWGRNDSSRSKSKVTPMESFEAGLDLVRSIVRKREKRGYERLE